MIGPDSPNPDKAKALAVGITENWIPGELPFHSHVRHQLMYSINGVMHVVTHKGRWTLPPSRAIWISSGTEHNFIAKRPLDLHILYIDKAVAQAPTWSDCVIMNVPPLIREMMATSVGFSWDYAPGSPESRFIGVLLEQLATLPQAPVNLPEPLDPRARKIVEMLRADLSSKLSLPELCEHAGASSRTIERLFKIETGMSFGDWRNRLRLIESLEILANGASIANVASEIGYDNSSSYIAAFKRLFDTTPGNYYK